MNAKRGYVPEDQRNFSPEAILTLKEASKHILYLLNEGYDLKQAAIFVGNHFMLSERQRLAVMRSVASGQQLSERKTCFLLQWGLHSTLLQHQQQIVFL